MVTSSQSIRQLSYSEIKNCVFCKKKGPGVVTNNKLIYLFSCFQTFKSDIFKIWYLDHVQVKKKYPFLKGDKSVYWAMKYPILSKQDWLKFKVFRKKEKEQSSGVSRTCCDHWPQLTWTVKRNFVNIVKAPGTHNADMEDCTSST